MKNSGKTSAIDKALEYFITQVNAGNWRVGDKIPSENQLTELIGVSRSSIRGAIQQATGIGAVESIHGKGTYLLTNDMTGLGALSSSINLKKETLRSLLEFRLILETGTAGLAAIRRTKSELNTLINLYQNMEQYNGNRDKFVMYDMLFHEAVTKASKNSFAIMTLMDVYRKKNDVFYTFNDVFGFDDGLHYHKLLVKAISDKDADNARKFMHDHFTNAIGKLTDQ